MLTTALAALLLFTPQSPDVGAKVYAAVATDNALDLAILNPAVPINAKPLVMAGEVVGVATSFLVDGQNVNFAVPMSVVRAFLSTTGASSQSPSTAAKMAQRALESLEQTKLRYEKQKDGVWVVTFEGKNLNSIPVFIIASEDMLVVSTQLKTAAPLTAETLRALLLASYDANYSKVAMNKNGDVMALTELGPDFTTTTFRRAVDEVASLADAIGPLVVVSERPAVAATEISRPGTGATMSLLRGAFELVYDPAKWRENKTAEGIQLVHRSGDAFLAIIDERIEASLDGLRDVAMENAKKAAPDATLLGETSRQINGLAVRLIRYGGTVNGAKFTFLNQIYTGRDGSVQLAAFTGSNLVTEYESDFLEVFAGFRRVR